MAEIHPPSPKPLSSNSMASDPIGDTQTNLTTYPEELDLGGPGLYGQLTTPSSHILIPLRYNIPTRTNGADRQGNAQQNQDNQNQLIVRRFQFNFQLDLALIIKLAAVVFLFSQEGSTVRLLLLVLSAIFIYLYQTGTLSPILRWIRQPIRPPPVRLPRPAQANNQIPEGNAVAQNPNPNPNQGGENVQNPNPNPEENLNANPGRIWVIIREIQLILIGFIASLLPGFQPIVPGFQQPHQD